MRRLLVQEKGKTFLAVNVSNMSNPFVKGLVDIAFVLLQVRMRSKEYRWIAFEEKGLVQGIHDIFIIEGDPVILDGENTESIR